MAKFSSYSSFALIFVVSLMFIGSTEIDARRLGGQKCTWGPSYWCKNIRQASAVSNCQSLQCILSFLNIVYFKALY